MFTLRLTKKLADRLRQPLVVDPSALPAPTTALGDWTANLVHVGRRQLVVAVSAHTFLPVVVDAAPASTLVVRVVAALGDVLRALGIPEDRIAPELHAMRDVTFAKATDRRALGMAVEYAFFLDRLDGLTPHAASLSLADIPCSPLAKREGFPDRATRVAFGCAPG